MALRLSKLALAVRAFTVQNGRAWSCVTHRADITDRAEIGRINALPADRHWPEPIPAGSHRY